MIIEEIPLVFDCQGSPLIGIIHLPEIPAKRGILAFAAGGPQYRAGVSRQLVYSAREISGQGIPFMRFDYRGMGDGCGPFRGYRCVEEDIRSAIKAFLKAVPDLSEIILWGGCDAATAVMLNAWRYPEVVGMIIANPFTVSKTAEKASLRSYYFQRLWDRSFWRKVFRGSYNPLSLLKAVSKTDDIVTRPLVTTLEQENDDSFVPKMLEGMNAYKGCVLLLTNDQNFIGRRFSQLIKQNLKWRTVMRQPSVTHINLRCSGREFAMVEARGVMISVVASWLAKWPSEQIQG